MQPLFPSNAIFTVTQLNRQIRHWLEQDIGDIVVEGEISNLSKPSSGHYYFTLKDASAQLRCVFFRNHHAQSFGPLENGQHVLAYGKLSVYEARGDYQLIVSKLEEVGQGDLFQQFEALKQKLAALGLFEVHRKKPLPKFPSVIGIVTSSNAAALQDILTTLKRRYSLAKVMIYPSEVQGKTAPQQLIRALQQANQDNVCDVILLARGGGSLEDLWAFNDEQLAYAIAKSVIPVVTGIGHETDFTIADFVADFRGATPTAAAEKVTPNSADLLLFLEHQQIQLIHAMQRVLRHKALLMKHALEKMASPKQQLLHRWQTLDFLSLRLKSAMQQKHTEEKQHIHLLLTQLQAAHPRLLISTNRTRLQHLEYQVHQHMQTTLEHKKNHLTSLLATLNTVSPLATLERGYAIASVHGKVLRSADEAHKGEIIHVQLLKGNIEAEIKAAHYKTLSNKCRV